jgi:uncharacterized protein (TIGR02284 family)
MPSNNLHVIELLNDLIATSHDSEEGFGKAAKGVHSDELRDMFTEISKQRAAFAAELEEHVRRLGGKPDTTGHYGALLHPGWGDLEARIRPKDDLAFLAECRRGEESSLKHFGHALARDLPPDIRVAVEEQANRLRMTIERLRGDEQTRAA